MVRVLKLFGFQERRQTGSHLILKNESLTACVPLHGREIPIGLFNRILAEAGLTKSRFFSRH